MAKAKYLKRVQLKVFHDCMDQIAPFIEGGDYDRALETMDEFRIDPNTMNPRGRTFAFLLIERQSVHGLATITAKETEEKRRRYFEFSKRFIDRGAELDHQDRYGLTLLNWAVWKACGSLCVFLLDRGASPNIPDCSNLPPLGYSMPCHARWNDSEMVLQAAPVIVPALLRAGADPYFAYPTYEEVQNNSWLSWALNGKRDNVFCANFMEDVLIHSRSKSLQPERLAVYKLFFDTCKELNLLKD